jgi:hypothetical protein
MFDGSGRWGNRGGGAGVVANMAGLSVRKSIKELRRPGHDRVSSRLALSKSKRSKPAISVLFDIEVSR